MRNTSFHKQFNILHFNHSLYEGEAQLKGLIIELCSSNEDWKKALGEFLKEWMDDAQEIELYTSGSTGVPKKISVSKSAMIYSAQRTLDFFQLQKGDTALLCLSSNYIAGKMMVVRALVGQLHLIANDVNSNPFKNLTEEIDFAALVPTQAKECFTKSKEKFRLVKTIILGGAKVDKELADMMNDVPSECWETYGMTETVSHIALRRITLDYKAPFKLLRGISISKDERSCLVIEPTDLNEHRLVTNDIIELKGENQFILKGRFDNVINTGGVKIFPEEVECKLAQKIKQEFVIIGLSDPKWGESVVLVIESKTPLTIYEALFEDLKSYEKPKKVYFLENFARTDSGKLQRAIIKENLVKTLNSGKA